MNCYLRLSHLIITASLLVLFQSTTVSSGVAHETGVKHLHFQKPGNAAQASSQDAKKAFRAPKAKKAKAKSKSGTQAKTGKQTRKISPVNYEEVVEAPRKKTVRRVATKQTAKPIRTASKKKKTVRQDVHIGPVSHGEVIYESGPTFEGEVYHEGCACEAQGGICEPGCGICEPGCGFAEPGCGIIEPGCGIVDGCGSGVNCGSCVGRPGPDYWCFPVCLPRFKDLSFWAGVHGFRGPRNFTPVTLGGDDRSDSDFGFQEGLNISGRAPLVGLLFPQLSYQLGYQAVQSRLSGTMDASDERSQHFVTAGLFRRVQTGLQFGVVWDFLRDDLDVDVDFHQIRSEISVKSPRGREFGFFATSSTNSNTIGSITYESTNQYAFFYRKQYGNGYECRFWGGATEHGEGIFGGDFYAPFNNRWALQSGFNYIIPEQDAGRLGIREEGWNVGINLVWHLGRTAKRGCRSPHRPLFGVADNGWMVIDNTTVIP